MNMNEGITSMSPSSWKVCPAPHFHLTERGQVVDVIGKDGHQYATECTMTREEYLARMNGDST